MRKALKELSPDQQKKYCAWNLLILWYYTQLFATDATI